MADVKREDAVSARPVIDEVRDMVAEMESANVQPWAILMTSFSYALLRKQNPEALGYDERGRACICIGRHEIRIITEEREGQDDVGD